MPDSPILRALVTPVILVVVFFAFARACASSAMKTRAIQIATAAPPETGLPSGSAPGAQAQRVKKTGEIEYPPGMTEDQVSYLVTVSTEFAEPMTATAGKNGYGDGFSALRRLGYVEQEEGSFRLTRDGLMNLRVIQETPDGWTYYVTKRVFERVTSVVMQPDGNARVTVSWHWEQTELAKAMGVRDQGWGAVADFRGNDNAWTLFRWVSSLKPY